VSPRFVAAGHKAGNLAVKRRDKVAELATENAALKGHIRALVVLGEGLLTRMGQAVSVSGWANEASDLKAAIDAAKLAK
jgi:hypothetical protein